VLSGTYAHSAITLNEARIDQSKEVNKQGIKIKMYRQKERREERKVRNRAKYWPVHFFRLTCNPGVNLGCQRNKNFNGNPKCVFPEYKAGAETTTCLCRSTDTVLPTYELALEARSFIYRDYKTL
jgi:hypothetical protein